MTPQRMGFVLQQVGALQAQSGEPTFAPTFTHADFCKCFRSPRATLRSCVCRPWVEIGGKHYRVSADGTLEALA